PREGDLAPPHRYVDASELCRSLRSFGRQIGACRALKMRIGGVPRLTLTAAVAAGLIAAPLMLEARLAKPEQGVDDSWKRTPIRRRGPTLLGFSFRPRQVEAF